jgi:hypothetical protein
VKHSFELAKGVCRTCHNSYCEECLIYSFGPKKPPYCVTCALQAGGVRRNGAHPHPRLRKKGIFGRAVVVEAEPVREVTFDDYRIELPDTLMGTSTATKHTRREVSPELVEAVASSDSSLSQSAGGTYDPTSSYGDDAPNDTEASLADWAASLGEPTGDAADAPAGAAAWPEESTAAPWPEGDNGFKGTSF